MTYPNDGLIKKLRHEASEDRRVAEQMKTEHAKQAMIRRARVSEEAANALENSVPRSTYDTHIANWRRHLSRQMDSNTEELERADAYERILQKAKDVAAKIDVYQYEVGSARVGELVKILDSERVCSTCGGTGVCGYPPDQYYECPDCYAGVDNV